MNEAVKYDFLEPILKNRDIHAKFLNTLSFLEYIGQKNFQRTG